MAKIGLQNFKYALLTEAEDGTPSYDVPKKPGKAVSCNVSISTNEAKLYADDGLAESDTSFQSGTVSIEVDNADQETQATLLGHTVDTNGTMVRSSQDTAPYVGFGRVVTKMVNSVYKYKVEFIYKCKFGEPSQEDTTKGENVEFGTSTLEGILSTLQDGKWSATKTFDTMAEAQAYLDELFGVVPVTTYTVTYNLNGGTGDIPADTVNAGDSVTLPDGTGITVPSGKTAFLGWAKTSSSTTATVTSPFTPDADITLYAVYSD